MSVASTVASEREATHEWEASHEWESPEWESPEWESTEWGSPEWESAHESDRFFPFLAPLAAKALPMIGRRLLPTIRRLLPVARRAVGPVVNSILATPGSAAPRAGVARMGVTGTSARPGSGRQRALLLLRQLGGIIRRGEAEVESAEAALFGTPETEWESGHPESAQAALTEVLAAEAAHTASEAEAEALLGAALPITIRIIVGRQKLRRVTPALVKANSQLVRGLRRCGPHGRQLLRLVPRVQRGTVASIAHMQRTGRPVPPAMVAPIMAAHAARVLGNPRISGPALVRNAVIRQRTVRPPRLHHRP
jgi:hypothetical protein